MQYFLNIYSPETHAAASATGTDITGFHPRHRNVAERVQPGDRLICYLTKLSRWCGLLEVIEGPFDDATPHFEAEEDPYTLRFRVKPLVWLTPENAVPIHSPELWDALSFTRGHAHNSKTWTGKVRTSLNTFEAADAKLIEEALLRQVHTPQAYPLSDSEGRALQPLVVRRQDGDLAVTVPTDDEEPGPEPRKKTEVRESIEIQALLCEIGHKMGMKLWLPANDRGRVLSIWSDPEGALLDKLPLNYDNATLTTIENIDVLWLKGRSIVRAFEVEHTTAVYSGLLRMADLLALQPNMSIRLHIVAPEDRREKVFSEIRRPVFSLLEPRPLAKTCTYLSYDSIRALHAERHLSHMSDSILKEYEERAEVVAL